MNARRRLPALVVPSLLAAAALLLAWGCGGAGPERIARVRAQYEARLNGFVVRDLPAEGEAPPRQEVLLDILVRRNGKEALSGLTLDLSVAGPGGTEKARRQLWVDTSGIGKGVEAQLAVTVADLDYQPGDGFHVEVRHPIPAAERGAYREFGAAP
ncbi:MAG: hypothetical protein KJ058_06315 [Thermoanaerobaculia bacterium]|nr:hypothetical protein [Thermoanaerobaculia bacterium]MCZ7651121.1 hypothetical protein [Thermoanaerobaculia bacterium]